MLNQNFQTFWYASFVYNSYYSDYDTVSTSSEFTDSTMDPADYTIVYNDS